ncbi:MAG: hypothetical protein ACE5G3_07360 [Gammaproteobacteria bacterium]
MIIVDLARRDECGSRFSTGRWLSVLWCVLLTGLAGSPAWAAEDWSGQLADALKIGEFDLGFRYRYEFVDAAGASKDANASTLRTRLVYKSAEFRDVSLTINMDDLRPIIGRDFNDTRNGKTQYPVVADPKGTDLNQAALTWTGVDGGTLVLGRQRIIRANHRFIGNVGWRQNEQTYDALTFAYRIDEKFDVFYGYIDDVRRIFGPESGTPTRRFESDSHLLDARYDFGPAVRLSGYVYLLDFDNAAGASNQTVGLRATGSIPLDVGPKLGYVAEFATQSDYKGNPVNYDADYFVIEGKAAWEQFGFRLGYEVLEGNGAAGGSFQTPLATLHAMNGWADKFLSTPAGGLEDFYIEGNVKFLQGNWRLIYHDFSANSGGGDYGDEIDFVASWKLAQNYGVMVKFASYSADQFSSDTDKLWVMLTANF